MKLKIYKFLLFLSRIYGRIVLNCGNRVFYLLRIRIQQHLLSNHKDITVTKVHKVAHLTCLHFLHGEIPGTYQEFYNGHHELFQEADELIKNSPELKGLVVDYFRLKAFYYVGGMKTEFLEQESEKTLKKAKDLNSTIEKLDHKGFNELQKTIRKSYRLANKELKSQIREYISEASYEVLPKVEITTSHITFMLSISTAIFLLTGYLHNKFFLGHFGIEVSKFFNINDYISSSVDKIYIACISSIVGVAVYVLGMISRIKNEVKFAQFEMEYNESNYQIFFTVFGLTSLNILWFYKDLPGKYSFLSILIFFVLIGVYHRLPIQRLVKNSIYVSVVFTAMAYFSVNIFWDTAKSIENVTHNSTALNKYIFSLKKPSVDNINGMVFLSANSGYLFFYDKCKNKSFVIPKSEITLIETQ